MEFRNKIVWTFLLASILSLKLSDGDGIRLPDQVPQNNIQQQTNFQQQQEQQQQQQQQQLLQQQQVVGEGRRQGKDLLDLVGLGTGSNVDPYVARTNGKCLSGDLAECFKTQALGTFDDFFTKSSYQLTENARVVRLAEPELRSLYQEPFEFSAEPRANDSEWDQLVKFALRKLEKFIKSVALEVRMPDELTEGGRYSPRFIEDIADEIDVIEDKKASLFSRHKLKKLIIPMLLVLKIFKLKLLLFLPFIFGLVSLKKLLALGAIVIPGLIGFFKLCRPQQNHGSNYFANNGFPQYSSQGLGYNEHNHFQGGNPFYRQEPSFAKPYTEYYSKANGIDNSVRFGDHHQDVAYQGYAEYRNNNKEVS